MLLSTSGKVVTIGAKKSSPCSNSTKVVQFSPFVQVRNVPSLEPASKPLLFFSAQELLMIRWNYQLKLLEDQWKKQDKTKGMNQKTTKKRRSTIDQQPLQISSLRRVRRRT